MNEKRVTSGIDIDEEDTGAGGRQRSTGCFQVSALCCCISKRRMHFPGRRPKERKKKNEKKKNTGDGSFGDTIFERRPQNVSRDYWKMTSSGDLGGIQTEGVKPALKVCIQTNDRKTQDPHIPVIPVTLTDICLEEKQQTYAEPTNAKTFCVQNKAWQQKEGTENVDILSLETKNRSLGAVSEGVAFEDGKDCLVMLAKENRQPGRPVLLSSLLQGATCEKEQQHGQDNVNIILEHVPCKQELKQDHQKMSFQELQHSAELEPHSTLDHNRNKFQEEQNSSTQVENVTYFQELNQFGEVHNDEQQAVVPQDIIPGVPHNTERPMDLDQLNSVSKGDAHEEDQNYEDMPSEEAQQTTELKYPDILSTMCGNYEQEQPEVQQQQDCVTEDSPRKTEHHYLNVFYQDDQPPVISKTTNTSSDKKQEETQAIKNSTSDTVLTNVEGHQYVPNLVDLQAAAHENVALPLGMTYKMDLQKLPYMTTLPDDVDMHIMEQKHPDTPQLLLLEQISTHHEEKEKQETQACAYSGSNVIAYIEEQESQELIVSQDTSILLGNVSHEKDLQRKLECGDSGPEGLYEKEDQDHQGPVYLEMKQPLLLAEVSSLPLNVTPGEELCISNDNTNVGKLEICPLDEKPEEQDNQHKMHTCACFKEKETTQGQEEQQPTLPPQAECNTQKEPEDSWQSQKATSMPYEVQKQKEQTEQGMTCEEYEKERQGLSSTTFSCSTREDEGHI